MMLTIELLIVPGPLATALAIANAVLCAVIAWACVCRIMLMDARTTRPSVRAGYAALLAAAMSSGAAPVLWGELPGPGQISMALVVLYGIAASYSDWRHGVPEHARLPHPPLSPAGVRR